MKQVKQLDHPDDQEFTLSRALHALSDPVRLEIVANLGDGSEHSSSAFACGVANSTLSHHLKVLRLAGIVAHRKEGTRCFVSLRPEFEKSFPGLLKQILRFREREAL